MKLFCGLLLKEENYLARKKLFKNLSFVLSLAVVLNSTSFYSSNTMVKAEGILAGDLFISEYIEGSSNNKAIEIYNGTGKDVDLTGYKLELYSNGATTSGNTLNFEGALKNGEVYIISHSQASSEIKAKANVQNAVANFNGDDALVLKHNDIIIDSFGKLGEDPGAAWGTGDNSTLDHTLIRKSSISKGDTITNDAFDPSVEWTGYAKDYISDLGKHTMDGSTTIPTVLLKGLTLPATLEMEEQKTGKLTCTYDPVNTTEKEVEWTSSDDKIATVSKDGTVTGVKAGEVSITATSKTHSDIKATTKVTVKGLADVTGPTITKITPYDGAFVNPGENLKTVSIEFNDPAGVDSSSIKLKIDGVDVSASSTKSESSVSYTSNTSFALGKHTIEVEVADKLGNKQTKATSFTVGTVEEVKYNHYFGQLHSHTNLSDGVGTPNEAFSYAKDQAKVDFIAVTDHSNWFDGEKDLKNETITDLSQSTSEEWKLLHKVADQYNENGKFVAMAGFEMTWSGSTGGWGHINTFDTNWFTSRTNSKMDLQAYYNKLAQPENSNSISQLNHPGKTFGDFSDFGFYSQATDNVVNLIEVGNGEGLVRNSGYFPSYEYYTRALDKGWHVAPTNNQDNHKGKWGDANTSKTVVLAKDLSRDSLYEAMRQRRVYATEDNNLNIDFTVNGMPMGTIFNNPTELKASVKINDADSTDKISKVSVIVDGGAVAASKTFDGNAISWDFDLPAGYKYYYIRVDEGDKDIAVTAPIWAGSVTPAGISKVEVSQNPQIVNTPVDVTATVYNNSQEDFSTVKVEFYENVVDDAHKIGENILSTVGKSNSGVAKITWTPKVTGDINIFAKTSINIQGKVNTFTQTTTITVANKNDLTKVVIDGGHQNQYVSGSYAGKMLTLAEMMKEDKYMLVQNPDELTATDLENAKILILTDPQSKDDTKNNLTKAKYSEAELNVIKAFVNGGGSVIITSRADYDDKTITDRSYESSVQGNSVLEAIGSNLRFNDDEVIDKTSNGGQEYRLYFDKYVGSKYGLTDNIVAGNTYSAYSGCSVILKDSADNSKVDWLVKGHDTTEILDSDLQNDATPVEKGNVYTLAAEELSNGAKVVVAGTTFLSDFETASNDDAYSNKTITDNIIKWMTAEKSAEVKTIAEVRVDANKDGIPDNLGKSFAIEGIVTAQSEAVTPKNAFFEVIYIQDATGGITIFGVSGTPVKVGQKVRITGKVDHYNGDAEIQIGNESKDLQVISSDITVVDPKVMTTGDSMKEENEGWLVKIQGKVTKMDTQNIWLEDGTGLARAYVEGYIGDGSADESKKGKWDSSIKVGDEVAIIGLASQDAEGHRLRVRNTLEITKIVEKVTITSIVSPAAVTVAKGNTATLPSTVTAVYSDGTQKEVAVKWGNVDTSVVGTKTVEGTVEGYTGKVTITVNVEKVPDTTPKPDTTEDKIIDNNITPENLKDIVSKAKPEEKIIINAQEKPVIEADSFKALKGIDKEVSFKLESQGKTIIWSFNGKDIKDVNTSVDLTLNLDTANKDIINSIAPNSAIISFKNHGELPAPMKVSIPVDTNKFDISKPIYFYYYNETTKKAELVGDGLIAYKIGQVYYVDVILTHNSDFFMTDTKVAEIKTETEPKTETETKAETKTEAVNQLVKTGSFVDFTVIASLGLVVIAIGIGFVLFRKKKEN
jgi:hypothetical protein